MVWFQRLYPCCSTTCTVLQWINKRGRSICVHQNVPDFVSFHDICLQKMTLAILPLVLAAFIIVASIQYVFYRQQRLVS